MSVDDVAVQRWVYGRGLNEQALHPLFNSIAKAGHLGAALLPTPSLPTPLQAVPVTTACCCCLLTWTLRSSCTASGEGLLPL